jgi:hypothetical protein
MTPELARRKIVLLSLVTTVAFACFLIVSPLFLPLSAQEAYQTVQIVFPVFAGYVGAAVIFLFRGHGGPGTVADSEILRYMVYAPFAIFWTMGAAVMFYFFVSNLPGGVPGMEFSQLTNYVTLLVSFMNATTGALTAFLFQSEELKTDLGLHRNPERDA